MGRKKYIFLLALFSFVHYSVFSQSVKKGDITLNANIGTPHLFKGIVKIATNSNVFKENFSGYVEVKTIKGLNPINLKADYAFDKMFSLGVNYSYWNMRFDVIDHYNAQRVSAGTVYEDSVDIYKIKISSSSFGVRPIFHFPLETYKNDLYIGFAFGITKNKISFDFSSTDAGRFAGIFGQRLGYGLSLPGGLYLAPSLGYRHYFNPHFGFNLELGYEKGAILQGGLVLRFHAKTKAEKKAGTTAPASK